MRGEPNRWLAPAVTRENERRAELERQASKLIRQSNHKQHTVKKKTKPPPPPAGPQRYTLADLPMLRRRGLVP